MKKVKHERKAVFNHKSKVIYFIQWILMLERLQNLLEENEQN